MKALSALSRFLPGFGEARIVTPSILQMEVVECGAACLAMILAYHGRFVPIEDLRYACGVSRDGSKASNILKAAHGHGMKAKGFKMEPESLHKLPLPFIVFWNFNHYVVVEGLGKDRVHINDPAAGRRSVTKVEFDESFTGVTLAFEPGPEFKKSGRPPSALDSLRTRLPGVRAALVYVLLASVGLTIPGLLLPSFSRVFVDYYLVQKLDEWLPPLLLAMTATAMIRMVLTWMQQEHLLRVQSRLSLVGSARFMWHVLRLPVSFFAQRYGGEIATRVSLNDRIAALITGDLATAVLNLVSIVVFGLLMLQYDPLLTGLGVTFGVLNMVVFQFVARRLTDANQKLLLDRGKLTGVTTQNIQSIDSFKAAGMESLFFSRIAAYHAKVVSAEQELGRQRIFLQSVPLLLAGFSSAAILVVGGIKVMDGALSIGMLVAFQMLMASFLAPIQSLVTMGGQLQEAQGNVNRIDDILRNKQDPEFQPVSIETGNATAEPALATPRLSGRLDIRDLTFGFSPVAPPLIKDFSLSLKTGMRVALVGGSGSGKSTIGKLIAGLYRPWSGQILYDGMAIHQVQRDVFRSSVAIVDQDIVLFEGTVRDNLTLWDDTVPDEYVVKASKDAGIHDDIASRPKGYDSMLQEGGRNFSGGQRQRIEIARALAANPTLLILDEATSALDAATEVTVVENLRRRGCSCVIIAHRLSTIRDCDEIIILDQGRIVQRGTHDAMKAVPGPYRTLIES
ncbi:MAG: NHLP family bacteriocin export ABC transporter peptidase/permease/ATPase subunit [Alphaproteobacteria bacterium]|nr:NHLP family bacteriocin export ABC transporter peptidase/permease/ATPase subunit [Alphaproteobacteria bacterium]